MFSHFILKRLNYIQIETYRLLQFLQIMFVLMRDRTKCDFPHSLLDLKPSETHCGKIAEMKVTEYNPLFTKLSILFSEMCPFWHTER